MNVPLSTLWLTYPSLPDGAGPYGSSGPLNHGAMLCERRPRSWRRVSTEESAAHARGRREEEAVYSWFIMLQQVTCYIASHVTAYNIWRLFQARMAVLTFTIRHPREPQICPWNLKSAPGEALGAPMRRQLQSDDASHERPRTDGWAGWAPLYCVPCNIYRSLPPPFSRSAARLPPRHSRPLRRPTPCSMPAAARFAALAFKCLHEEYPNHLSHTLSSDADVRPPRELTPAFYGCYDWHSAVHGHWLLVRLMHLFPDALRARGARRLGSKPDAGEHCGRSCLPAARGSRLIRASLRSRLAPGAVRGAARLERPAGAAVARGLAAARDRSRHPAQNWAGKLHYPVRVGEHDQTAFAFSLVWDWAERRGRRANAKRAGLFGTPVLLTGSQLPDRLRAIRRGFPLALPRRGGLHAPRCSAPRRSRRWLSDFLPGIPKNGAQPVALARRRDRPRRSEARAHRWPQLEPRMDARGNRARIEAGRPAHQRAAAARSGIATPRSQQSPASITSAATGSAHSRCT